MPSVHLFPVAELALQPERPHIDFMRVSLNPRAGRGLPNIGRFRSKAREAAGFRRPALRGALCWLSIAAAGPAAGRIAVVAFLVLAAPLSAGADSLFANPGLGMAPVQVPRVVPKVVTPGVPSFNANQCLLMAGTCPTGRLQRSGNLCFCVSGNGTVRQGTTRIKPQGARPAIDPDP